MNKLSISLLIFACLSCYVDCQAWESTDSEAMNGTIQNSDSEIMNGEIMNGQNTDGHMFEDDMIIGTQKNTRAFGLKYKRQRWTNGVIPYTISRQFGSSSKSKIRAAMDLIESKTAGCIKFVSRTSQSNYVSIQSISGCYSYVGMNGGMQKLSLGQGCVHKGIIVHELMHAIGFMHEQNRPDRDTYVTINFQNVNPSMRSNFKKYTSNYKTYGRYDYYSIMQYNSKAFSTNGRMTIVPKDRNVKLIHNSLKTDKNIMTTLDVNAVKALYECDSGNGRTDKPIKVTTKKPSSSSYQFTMENDLKSKVKVYWVNSRGQYVLYKTLYPGYKYVQNTYKRHKWAVYTTTRVKRFVIGTGKFKNNNVRIKVSQL